MQFGERIFQTQFSVSADKLYEWNIDGLSEQEIINKMSHMSMVGIAYQNNHDPYWKERFIDGLPPIFAHKVK